MALLEDVLAQPTAIGTLKRALSSGRVHHAYLFDGPAGVGKELAAFGLAQALVCERRPAFGDRACGTCGACSRAAPGEGGLPRHPDVTVLERGLYQPAQIGRRTEETQDLSIDQVRTLVLARAAFPPHEGRAKVFVVRRAEELSQAAANALLKTLEEPIDRTYFVLLSATPHALLPTIRSRTQRVRFAPLPDDAVTAALERRGVRVEMARAAAALAGGSVESALVLCDAEEAAARAEFVERALRALDSPDLGLALELAEEAKRSKEGLEVRLLALANSFGEEARALRGRSSDVAAKRHPLVLAALRELDRNASAQLVVESMMVRMRAC
jgi:DNA polymerase-3 subunit delta'